MRPEHERILALARGQLPAGVQEDSTEGRHYRRLIAHIQADVADAPMPSDETKRRVLVLLGGGRHE